jgi:hypothetical protein
MAPPRPSAIRYRVEPLDVPPAKAARRLHLTLAEFRQKLTQLEGRGFPRPDPTTGNYYLPAINQWMAARAALTATAGAQNDKDLINERIARL